jgi:hypothetical protein
MPNHMYIEQGIILRPGDNLLLASNADDCTYRIRSLDCYFRGMSSCRMENSSDAMHDDRVTTLGQILSMADICTLAVTSKTSVAWELSKNYLENFKNESYLQERYGGNFYYKFLPQHLSMQPKKSN